MRVRPCVLEGGCVRLVPLVLDHLDGLCAVGLDEELWRWTVSQVRTRDEMRAYIEAALGEFRVGRALPFTTFEKRSNRAVGSTRFGSIDAPNRRLEIGWTWLGRPWQRTPLNTEAKYLMLRHAFETLGCLRVEFKTDALNDRSRRALLRIGATEEGILRSHVVTATGRVRDSVYYSLLAREWPAVKDRLERRLSRGSSPEDGAGVPEGSRPGSGVPEGSPPGSTGRRLLPDGFERPSERLLERELPESTRGSQVGAGGPPGGAS